jgi:VanZ family protein
VTPRILATSALVFLGLAALSLGPFPQPDLPGPLELLPHAIAYATGTIVLLALGDRDGGLRRHPTRVLPIAASMILLGIVLELGQGVVGRNVEAWDVVANSLGVAIAVAIWGLTRRVRRASGRRR